MIFLGDGSVGYYSIYQLIRSQKRQAAFYLSQIPALKKQILNILAHTEKDEACVLLKMIASMYEEFENNIGLCGWRYRFYFKKNKALANVGNQ
ncbi:MAG: hypothetical protein MZV65_32645 [Chromatiales bacterium]|nr:hypothetical protein [Chromatiales bacterium]